MKENLYEAIARFIDQISTRLPSEAEFVRMDHSFMFGFELKLTGIKDYKGNPIEDGGIYKIDVPVYEGKMEIHEIVENGVVVGTRQRPVVRFADHRQQLRMAYLKSGRQGIYQYLGKYMSAPEVEKVKKTFMRING